MPPLEMGTNGHRRAIVPWYDSESICLVILFFMLLVFWFGFIGIQEGMESAESSVDLWVPISLMAISSFVILSITIRLVRRYLGRFT